MLLWGGVWWSWVCVCGGLGCVYGVGLVWLGGCSLVVWVWWWWCGVGVMQVVVGWGGYVDVVGWCGASGCGGSGCGVVVCFGDVVWWCVGKGVWCGVSWCGVWVWVWWCGCVGEVMLVWCCACGGVVVSKLMFTHSANMVNTKVICFGSD